MYRIAELAHADLRTNRMAVTLRVVVHAVEHCCGVTGTEDNGLSGAGADFKCQTL
jgi:hypothetical protein